MQDAADRKSNRQRADQQRSVPQAGTAKTRFLGYLAAAYGLLWVALAIDPVSRFDWFLENILVLVGVSLVAASCRGFRLSRSVYLLIAAFLALHAFGAHYTYSLTPVGESVAGLLGLERNHYDRVVHFAFGLLLAYPFLEFLERYVMPGHKAWSAAFCLCLILALSGLYEIFEWGAAMVLEPDDALAFLGTQGDIFDGQKDAALAFAGGLLGLALALIARRLFSRH